MTPAKPTTIAYDFLRFPLVLRSLLIWVLWKFQWIEKSGNWTKVPFVAGSSSIHAKCNDPGTWNNFNQALLTVQHADGLGIVLTDGYCGIDLDCCRNRETGEIAPWAARLIKKFDSYCEASPSGEGLHIIVRLTKPLPKGLRKRGGKEQGWELGIYDQTSPRYFCVTGVVHEKYDTIRDLDPDNFYSKFASGELDPTPARNLSPTGNKPNLLPIGNKPAAADKLTQLMRGEWQGLYPSPSEADFALVGMLADKFFGNAEVIDKIFRSSGLMREKWDEPRPEGTYGSVTIAHILEKRNISNDEWREPTRDDAPESILDGLLGDICHEHLNRFPRAYAWPALITIAGGLLGRRASHPLRANLFAALVGPVHSGKSLCADYSMRVLGMTPKLHPLDLAVQYGSAEALVEKLSESGSDLVRILHADELATLLQKAMIDGASYCGALSEFFYSDHYESGTKKKRVTADCRLSVLGGIVDRRFEECFGSATVGGLYDRFIFGLCPTPYEFEYRPFEGEAQTLKFSNPRVDPEVWTAKSTWVREGFNARVGEIALRVAYISAAADGREILSVNDLGPALAFVQWQTRCRSLLAPNEGLTLAAKCENSIRGWVAGHLKRGEAVSRRSLYRAINAYRYGSKLFDGALYALHEAGDLRYDRITHRVWNLALDVKADIEATPLAQHKQADVSPPITPRNEEKWDTVERAPGEAEL
jgi:hypothetical protein